MKRHSARVTFKPDGKEIWVDAGTTVKDALFAASIPLSMPCGGHGRCGRCVVRIAGKVSGITPEEKSKLPRRAAGARLACLARIEGDVTVTVPLSSRLAIQRIRSRGLTHGAYRLKPAGLKAGLEAGDGSSHCYGAAVDIGTNTVVCSLVNLVTAREVARVSAINPQLVHGDDVISRIRFSKVAGGLEVLRAEIVNLINGLLTEVTRKIGVDPRRIYALSAVGNTAMQQILLGISPADLGRAPYRVARVSPLETLASRVGIRASRDCVLLVAPVVGGFVGGDLVALIISQSLHRRKVPVLAADLGTNGEIVVAGKGIIGACSTAAGPAFEGERISSGVRAVRGAIEDVRIADGRLKIRTIGRARPLGLCGSGLLAAIGELVRARVIEPSGRIKTRKETRPRTLAARVVEGDRGREFLLSLRPRLGLRQGDVREVQLGKAAVCAGIRALLGAVGIRPEEIAEVLIAGGFGSALRASSIKAVGLLPPGVEARVKIVGNSAIEGAKIFLVSEEARARAQEIAARAQHIELFSRPEFKEDFYTAMSFPSP